MKVGEVWICTKEDDQMLGHLSRHYGDEILGHKVRITEMGLVPFVDEELHLMLEHIDRKGKKVWIDREEFVRCFKKVHNEAS